MRTTYTITTTPQYDPDGTALQQAQQTADGAPLQTATYTQAVNAADWPITTTDILTSGQPLVTAYGYDGAGQVRTRTILNGATPVTDTLNAEGLVTATTESLGGLSYTSAFTYNQDDLPLTITLPGGVQQTAQYDAADRLTHLGASGPSGVANVLSSSYDYGYDATGRTMAITTTLNGGTPVTQTLTHDALDRLTGAQSSDGTRQSWTYDGNGNLLTSATNGVTTTYGYANNVAPNEVLTLTTPGQPTTYYGYDTHGDTTSITTTGAITGLSYDRQARLSTVTLPSGTTVAQSYNARGQRASYAVTPPGQGQPSLSMRFLYRGDVLGQAVVTGIGVTAPYTDTYLYTPDGLPLELLRQQGAATSRYWHVVDGRNNVVALTDVNGNVVDRYAYDLWGQPTSTSESVAQPFRYAGYWYDGWAGGPLPWYWLAQRSYDPTLDRFLQPDPSQGEGVRVYAYAEDDPLDGNGPLGLGTSLRCATPTPCCLADVWYGPTQVYRS